MRLEVVRTRTGKRLHFAATDSDLTLCGCVVYERRVGGSWRPEQDVAMDHWPTCLKCGNEAIEGERP